VSGLRRCPRCRSFRITWREHTDTIGEYVQSRDGIAEVGYFHPGFITGIDGVCRDCRHAWQPRGEDGRKATQLWSLPGGMDRIPRGGE
jgi:hypothetical protein